ncbi:unnamed protein product [Ophioblennius macclurei]
MRPLMCVLMIAGISCSEVKNKTLDYSCCGHPALKYDLECKSIWKVKGMTFAHYAKGWANTCHPPCRSLRDGLLTLDQCVELVAEVECEAGIYIEETLIRYVGTACTSAPTRSACESCSRAAGAPVSLPSGLMMAALLLFVMVL